MAVYEQRYKPFDGPFTPQWSRFLVIPRHAYASIFRSKLFTAFFAVCFVPMLVASILVYLHHNASALFLLQLDLNDLVPIDHRFFHFLLGFQGMLAFLLTVFVGPRLVARDVTDNAVALYLARPFSRVDYVLGKLSVLGILLSLVTWVPQLLLFAFQAYLADGEWLARYGWVAWAILAGNLSWVVLLALLALAISAWVKWATAARAALIALYFVPFPFAALVNELFDTHWGGLLSLGFIFRGIWGSLFGLSENFDLPGPTSWVMLFIVYAISLGLLSRKIRAYEVIK